MTIRSENEITPDQALNLLLAYKRKKSSGISWGQVEMDIQAAGHEKACLIDRKKLRHWHVRKTINPQAFKAVQHFIFSEQFTSVVPEAFGVFQKQREGVNIGSSLAKFHGFLSEGRITSEINFSDVAGIWIPNVHSVGSILDPDEKSFVKAILLILPAPKRHFAFVTAYQAKTWVDLIDFNPACLYSGYIFYAHSSSEKQCVFKVWNREDQNEHVASFHWETFEWSMQQNKIGWPATNFTKRSFDFDRFNKLRPFKEQFAAAKNILHFENDRQYLRFQYLCSESCDLSRAPANGLFNNDFLRTVVAEFDKIKFSVVREYNESFRTI